MSELKSRRSKPHSEQSSYSPPIPPPSARAHHLDNLRTCLTILVVYHHASIPNGGLGSFPYTSPHHPKSYLSPPLLVFNALNQSFFMGSFFFLSGVMSCEALRRKGRWEFWKSKVLKLGVPTLVYTLFAPPIISSIIGVLGGEAVVIDGPRQGREIWIEHLRSLKGVRGPVWYCTLLLIFDTVYAQLSRKYPSKFSTSRMLLEQMTFGKAMALNISTSFLIRLIYPVGRNFTPLNLQPAYLPQYIYYYTFGTYFAGRSETSKPTAISTLTPPTYSMFIISSFLSTTSLITLFTIYPSKYPLSSISGGFNFAALSYTVWNETTGYLISSSLLHLFTPHPIPPSPSPTFLHREWKIGNPKVAKYSYAAFLVHILVLVTVQAGLDRLGWMVVHGEGVWREGVGSVVQTVIVGTAGVLGSCGLGWILVGIPVVRRVVG